MFELGDLKYDDNVDDLERQLKHGSIEYAATTSSVIDRIVHDRALPHSARHTDVESDIIINITPKVSEHMYIYLNLILLECFY